MSLLRFVRWIVEGHPLQLNGDGMQQRDFTHVDDVARGVLAVVDRRPGYETINLGSDKPVELNSVIEQIERTVGEIATVEHLPFSATDMMAI
jgi:UDP-glucuronate 4-epimerase